MTQEAQLASDLTRAMQASNVDATIALLEKALDTFEQLGVQTKHQVLLEAVSNRITMLLDRDMEALAKADIFSYNVQQASVYPLTKSPDDLFNHGLLYQDSADYILADKALARHFLVEFAQGKLSLNDNDVALNCFIQLYQQCLQDSHYADLLMLVDEALNFIESNLDDLAGFDEFEQFDVNDFSLHHKDLNFYDSVGPYPFLVTVSEIARSYAMRGYYQTMVNYLRDRQAVNFELVDTFITLSPIEDEQLKPWLGEMRESPEHETRALFSPQPNGFIEYRFNKLGAAIPEFREAGHKSAKAFLDYVFQAKS
ncbi:hypothetical protein [Pseudoalteromonas sp. T1lg10]|uniref:hypothetical protein n=1 Tax=Pseudoalteromonas sp. T1lg10 TaxID=2077093 RepID=UPI001319CCC5|nr:hypothetical protein [Pseudoalteromonas sp. T1lg10]